MHAAEVVPRLEIGVPISVVAAEAPIARLSRRDDSYPWNGGTYIVNPDAPVGAYGCTAAFGVQDPRGNRYVLTAGHCGH